MKSKLTVLGVLLLGPFGWAAPQQFTFVTVLSSPVASFKEIETKYTQVPTEFVAGSQVNLGSFKSGSGSITIEGGAPVQIDKLNMEEDTTFSVGDNKKWIVDSLTIGADGEVAPQSAHIQTLTVPSGSTLKVTKNLIMQGPINLNKDGSSVNSVTIGTGSSKLTINSLGAGTGNFVELGCSSNNVNAGTCSAGDKINVLKVQ